MTLRQVPFRSLASFSLLTLLPQALYCLLDSYFHLYLFFSYLLPSLGESPPPSSPDPSECQSIVNQGYPESHPKWARKPEAQLLNSPHGQGEAVCAPGQAGVWG